MRQHFDDFVTARGGLLWRTAWLLTGDVDRAEELLEAALARVSSGRDDAAEGVGDGLDDQALAALVRAYLPRRGGDEAPSARPRPDADADVTWTDEDRLRSELRAEVVAGLASLTPYQRAAVVLLHAELRDPAEVAGMLGWSPQRLDGALAGATALLRRSRLVCDPATNAAAAAAATPAPGHGRLTTHEIRWLRVRLADAAPEPPFAPDRLARAKAAVDRRRRRTLFGAVAGLVALGALLVPTVLAAWPDEATGGASNTAAAAGPPELPLPPLEDPRDVPATCAGLGEAPTPAAPLDLAAYRVLWLRFCPVGDFGEALTDLNFAPGVVATHGLTGVVGKWVSVPGRAPCAFAAPRNDGWARLQIGTADGVTHVVDAEIGVCGEVVVDGRSVAVNGRRVFADAVDAVSDQLARQFASQPPRPGPGVSDLPRCPRDPTLPGEADRFVTSAGTDYPRVVGMPLPLPVEAGLVCSYQSRGGGRAARLESTREISTRAAEQIRAAYLARLPPSGPGCETHPGAGVYAVVLIDVTGSWQTFSLDRVHCDQVIGPGAERGTAGQWLLESVVWGIPPPVP